MSDDTTTGLWSVCGACGCVVADEAKHENNCAGSGKEEMG